MLAMTMTASTTATRLPMMIFFTRSPSPQGRQADADADQQQPDDDRRDRHGLRRQPGDRPESDHRQYQAPQREEIHAGIEGNQPVGSALRSEECQVGLQHGAAAATLHVRVADALLAEDDR